jgi:hypothetical protein
MLPTGPAASTVLVGSGIGTLLGAVCAGAFVALVIGFLVARRERRAAAQIVVDEAKTEAAQTRLSA